MPEVQAPVPEPDALGVPFWEACRNGRLEFPVCEDCGHGFLPPGPCCPRCWSPRLTSRVASGRGHVFSFAVYRRTYHPGMPAPYVVALVELEEGPRLITNVVACAPEAVEIDMPVQLRFEPAGDFMLPRFAPVVGEEETP